MIDDEQLAQTLLDEQIIDAETLQQGQALQQEEDLSLYEALIESRLVSEAPIIMAVSNILNVPCIGLDQFEFDDEILDLIPPSMAQQHHMLPLSVIDDHGSSKLMVAMADPLDITAMDVISNHTGIDIQPVLVGPLDLEVALARAFPVPGIMGDPAAILQSFAGEDSSIANDDFDDEWADAMALSDDYPPSMFGEESSEPFLELADEAHSQVEISSAISQEMRDRPTTLEFEIDENDLDEDQALADLEQSQLPGVTTSQNMFHLDPDKWELDEAISGAYRIATDEQGEPQNIELLEDSETGDIEQLEDAELMFDEIEDVPIFEEVIENPLHDLDDVDLPKIEDLPPGESADVDENLEDGAQLFAELFVGDSNPASSQEKSPPEDLGDSGDDDDIEDAPTSFAKKLNLKARLKRSSDKNEAKRASLSLSSLRPSKPEQEETLREDEADSGIQTSLEDIPEASESPSTLGRIKAKKVAIPSAQPEIVERDRRTTEFELSDDEEDDFFDLDDLEGDLGGGLEENTVAAPHDEVEELAKATTGLRSTALRQGIVSGLKNTTTRKNVAITHEQAELARQKSSGNGRQSYGARLIPKKFDFPAELEPHLSRAAILLLINKNILPVEELLAVAEYLLDQEDSSDKK